MVLLSPSVVVMLLTAVATPPPVLGTTACPSSEEVAGRLAPMWSPQSMLPSGSFLELVDVPARVSGLVDVEIRLRTEGDGAPVAARRVERASGCSETADALAVIAASWAGRYSTPGPPPVPVSAVPGPAVTVAAAARPPSRAVAVNEISFGALVGVVAAPSGAGGSALLAGIDVGARRGSWVASLTIAGAGERSVAVADGEAIWRRLMLIPTVGFNWGSPRAFAQLGAGPVVALTETRGAGFVTNGSDRGFDWGLAPRIQLGARFAALPAVIWVGGTVFAWLRPHSVAVEGVASRLGLPRADLFVGGGLTFLLGSNS